MKQRGSAVRCAIYARVSTADQSLENQLAQLLEFAACSGWEITQVYTDEASAKIGNRSGFRSRIGFPRSSTTPTSSDVTSIDVVNRGG